MIINFIDVSRWENPGSGNDGGNATTWWIGRVLGPLWGPSLKNLLAMLFLSV